MKDGLKKQRIFKFPTIAWAIYDLANTIFSLSILSFFFPLWITRDNGGVSSAEYALTVAISMLAAASVLPILGAISDSYGKRIPFLRVFVIICVGCTALLGQWENMILPLILFAIANFAYQSAEVFYNSLLPEVSSSDNRGLVSGFGVGVGYIGSILTIILLAPLATAEGADESATFLPTAILYILIALPLFFAIRERRSDERKFDWKIISDGYTQLYATLKNIKENKNLFQFIVARFFYLDAINTLIAFMAIYVTAILGEEVAKTEALNLVGISFTGTEMVLIFGILSALFSAFFYGWMVTKIGPKITLLIILAIWSAALVWAVLGTEIVEFYGVAILAGSALGGTWTADRVLLTRIAPAGQVGQFFGLYQMVGRLSAVIGPLLWASVTAAQWILVAKIFNWIGTDRVSDQIISLTALESSRMRIALVALLVLLIVGVIVLRKVKDEEHPSHDIQQD